MNRIEKVQKTLKEQETLLLEDPVDLLYLTGQEVSVGQLLIFPDQACFFVDGRYFERAKKELNFPVYLKDEFKKIIEDVRLGIFDSSYTSYDRAQFLMKEYPKVTWKGIPKPIKKIRAMKEKKEIVSLKKAAKITWDGYKHLLSFLKEGITEQDLALEFEFYCRKKGASHLSFPSIIAFGENSAYPHYRAGKVPLKKDQIILFDLGAVVDGYAGDMTRVFFFGKGDPQLEKDYALLQKVQSEAVAKIRPGIFYKELDQFVRAELKKESVDHLFTHSLSHGIGLDVHEYPFMRLNEGEEIQLEAGMTFTVEPGLYRPGLGGVRYEDTVLVTESGVENFYS